MKKMLIGGGLALFALALAMPAMAASVEKTYSDVSLSGGFQAENFEDVYDLTACDMTIDFTYDGNGLVDDSGAHAWSEFGIRGVGYGNFNPTWAVEGAGVWLATDYDWTANTFDPDITPSLDLDDKLILQKAGGTGEDKYNLPSVPPVPGNNHRFWFDRDGVDPWQNDETANTGGLYNISLKISADDATNGKAYMEINDLDQGFETDSNWSTIELTPAGMSFTGDMKNMQVFYGIYGYGATHHVAFKDIKVSGCFPPVTVTIAKYLDGIPATTGSYPMVSSWAADNIGAASGSYTLDPVGFNNTNPYQATTSSMTSGADYSTYEETSADGGILPIGSACQVGKTRLVGYSDGDSLANAALVVSTSTEPDFTDITSNKYVIVWNESCTTPTTVDQCKKNGWKNFNAPVFRNQGDCVSWLQANENATGNRKDN